MFFELVAPKKSDVLYLFSIHSKVLYITVYIAMCFIFIFRFQFNDLAQSNLEDDEKRELVRSLTLLFGKVHQMSRGELVANLKQHNLQTEGTRDVLMKRLKNYYRVQKLLAVNITPAVKFAPYYMVVDFEATCNTVNAPDYP